MESTCNAVHTRLEDVQNSMWMPNDDNKDGAHGGVFTIVALVQPVSFPAGAIAALSLAKR